MTCRRAMRSWEMNRANTIVTAGYIEASTAPTLRSPGPRRQDEEQGCDRVEHAGQDDRASRPLLREDGTRRDQRDAQEHQHRDQASADQWPVSGLFRRPSDEDEEQPEADTGKHHVDDAGSPDDAAQPTEEPPAPDIARRRRFRHQRRDVVGNDRRLETARPKMWMLSRMQTSATRRTSGRAPARRQTVRRVAPAVQPGVVQPGPRAGRTPGRRSGPKGAVVAAAAMASTRTSDGGVTSRPEPPEVPATVRPTDGRRRLPPR